MAKFQPKSDIGHTMRFPDGSDTKLLPANSMMTNSVLIELAGLGKGSSRWVWTLASCLRTDEENEWRAEWRSGCNHSLEVSLQEDKHHSKTRMRVMKERGQRKERMKHERDDSDAQRQSKTLRALVFRQNTNFLCQLNEMKHYQRTSSTVVRLCWLVCIGYRFTL